ncbi:hypothetical protein MSG28_000545 [Choristoneura fumiferana]|uniref:Uncharacterized protein n=1 Tax=Choristoneura fumiferana TaxID=7141 RepID=A0ACC0K1X9_CHOFU|nr:hypothetical protein MSG28_000545 [Choristoneura fumiferana]
MAGACMGSAVAELEAPWAGFVEGAERLARGDADAALRALDSRLSLAIMHALENHVLLDKKGIKSLNRRGRRARGERAAWARPTRPAFGARRDVSKDVVSCRGAARRLGVGARRRAGRALLCDFDTNHESLDSRVQLKGECDPHLVLRGERRRRSRRSLAPAHASAKLSPLDNGAKTNQNRNPLCF